MGVLISRGRAGKPFRESIAVAAVAGGKLRSSAIHGRRGRRGRGSGAFPKDQRAVYRDSRRAGRGRRVAIGVCVQLSHPKRGRFVADSDAERIAGQNAAGSGAALTNESICVVGCFGVVDEVEGPAVFAIDQPDEYELRRYYRREYAGAGGDGGGGDSGLEEAVG